MNKWIKDLNIDINNEKLYYINNIYFKIINKTISSHKKKYFMKNDITKREEEILNSQKKSISPNLQELLAKTMIWNFKTINKKNNEINNIINNDKNKKDYEKNEFSETAKNIGKLDSEKLKDNNININYFNQTCESNNILN